MITEKKLPSYLIQIFFEESEDAEDFEWQQRNLYVNKTNVEFLYDYDRTILNETYTHYFVRRRT